MWSTFLAMMRINLREKSGIFWMLCFPIILATLLQGVFGDISESNTIEALPVAVVQDKTWDETQGAQSFVDALADSDSQSTALMTITGVSSAQEGERQLADGTVKAMLAAGDDGRIIMTISDTMAGNVQAANVNGGDATSITLSALSAAIDVYNVRNGIIAEAVATALADNPQLAHDAAFWQSLASAGGSDVNDNDRYAKEITLTRFSSDPMARYHFALLGMAAMMSVLFACATLVFTQANLSASGARIAVSPLPRSRMVAGVFLAGWLMSFLTLSAAFLFIRYALGITVGGREWLAEAGILVASFSASAMGLALGAIPKLSLSLKNGIAIGLSTGLAMLAGLMGKFSMQLNDSIQTHAPIVHLISPVKQVSNLFYDLLYYDSLDPFVHTIVVLLVMGAIALMLTVALLGRQRYEHL